MTPLLHYQARLDRAGDIRDFDRLPSVGYNSADSTKTSGFDLEFNHKHRFDWFDFKSDLPWKYMKRYSIEIHGVTYQLAGTHDPSGTSGDTGNARDHLQWSNAGTIGNFRWPKR